MTVRHASKPPVARAAPAGSIGIGLSKRGCDVTGWKRLKWLAMGGMGFALAACGGGGSSSNTGNNGGSGTGAPSTTYVAGQYLPESTFAQLCLAPRTGIDPVTKQAYTDRQGTLLDEENWLRSWTHDLYLWFEQVPDTNPANYASDATYFAALKTTALTASGAPVDKFHFTYPTSVWESLSQSGVSPGYGIDVALVATHPPRRAVIAYTEPAAPTTTISANLARGAEILEIDGVDLVNANDQASIDTLNAGLTPQTVGEMHTFTVMDIGATSPRTVTLTSASVTETPVQNVKTLTTVTGPVGYLLFNDHIATAESELIAAFTQLAQASVTDLVLDIRYNGGGYLDIASEVAYMIAGPTATAGQTFELQQFNSQHPTMDPVTGAPIAPLGFHSTSQGLSTTAGTALPSLNLTRVFVLTTSETCSASESIINSLRGINVQVIEVGTTTCGKPYGFYPADNCGTTYFSIQFRGVNAMGFGDYTDGFTPANTTATQGTDIPGCSVADDFTHALGDPAEGQLASALGYRGTGMCPVAPAAVASAAAHSMKPVWKRNRLFRMVH